MICHIIASLRYESAKNLLCAVTSLANRQATHWIPLPTVIIKGGARHLQSKLEINANPLSVFLGKKVIQSPVHEDLVQNKSAQ